MCRFSFITYTAGVLLGEAVAFFNLSQQRQNEIVQQEYSTIAADSAGELHLFFVNRNGLIRSSLLLPNIKLREGTHTHFLAVSNYIKPITDEGKRIQNEWANQEFRDFNNASFWKLYKQNCLISQLTQSARKIYH